MKRILFIVLTTIFYMVQTTMAASVYFRTKELKRLAVALAIPTDTLHKGYQDIEKKGKKLIIHVGADSVIDHIGLALFPETMKKSGNKVVMEFLERYLLQLQYPPSPKTAAMMLRDDNVKFEVGSIATIPKLLPTDGFGLSCEQMKYTATWLRDGKTILSLTFPAEFELLRGMNIIEAQHQFENESRKAVTNVGSKLPLDKQLMKATGTENCYVLEGDFYLNEELNANRYYTENANGQFLPILSEDHPIESAANLMLCPEISGQRKLHITERLYGFQQKDFELDLHQWITFCQGERCKLYFGVQELSTTAVKATVIAVNTEENYNHMLTLTIPFTSMSNSEGVIEAMLNCYLPTHNIQNLFGNDHSKKKAKYHL